MARGKGKGKGRGRCSPFYMMEEMAELGRSICGCICCLYASGPILFIIGIFFFMSATHNTRAENIADYNKAVDAWTSTYRAPFVASDFAAYTAETQSILLNLDESDSDKLNDNDKELKTYQQARFRATYPMWSPVTLTDAPINQQGQINFQCRASNHSTVSDVPVTGFFTYKNEIKNQYDLNCDPTTSSTTSSDRTKCSTACSNNKGVWDSFTEYCYIRSKTTDVCVKLREDNGHFSLDFGSKNQGAGCFHPFTVNTESQISQTGNVNINWNSMSTAVRSPYDPFVVASELTNGSMSFGLTTAQKLMWGTFFMASGGALMGCMGLTTVYLFKFVFGRNKGYQNMERQPIAGQGYQAPPGAYQQQPPPAAYPPQPSYPAQPAYQQPAYQGPPGAQPPRYQG